MVTPAGEDGYRFEFERLPSGMTEFSVQGATGRWTRIRLNGDRDDIELTMDDEWLMFATSTPEGRAQAALAQVAQRRIPAGPKRAVELSFKASDGGRVPDFRVTALVRSAGETRGAFDTYVVHADVKAGQALLEDVPVDATLSINTMWSRPAGYWTPQSSFAVPAGEGVHRFEVPVYAAGAAVVEVVDTDGSPRDFDWLGLEGRDPHVPAERAGRFSIEGHYFGKTQSRATLESVPLGGKYRVVVLQGARVGRSGWFTLDAAKPRADVQVRLPAAKPIVASVRSATGAPLPGVDVSIGYQSAEIEHVPVWSDKVKTDAEGRALFANVTSDASANYGLMVSPRRDWQPRMKTASAIRHEEWTIALSPGFRASGRVVDAAGQPVADVEVRAMVDEKEARGSAASVPAMGAEETTDAHGRFRFSTLVPGRLVFRVDHRRPAKNGDFPRLDVKADVASEIVIVVD